MNEADRQTSPIHSTCRGNLPAWKHPTIARSTSECEEPVCNMSVSVIIKWGGQEYSISSLSEEDTVMDLKQSIKTLTGVLPERQKLLGLKVKGKPAEDVVKLGALKLKPNTKIMMMGTREESLEEVLAPPPENDDVVNDFDIEEEVIEVENRLDIVMGFLLCLWLQEDICETKCTRAPEGQMSLSVSREENLAKIARRVKDYKVEEMNPPREGKGLLVLDVDYTLFDHKSCAETGQELMRPYLHEFLTSAYEDYDIVIWSATSMKWIDAKMKELGVTDNPNYKITFMLDSAAMITVHTPKRGVVEVKPLGVIWGKYEEFYNRRNTIMFDDIGRNFLMNPQNGLKIRPFMKAHLNREKDRELYKLAQYLKEIAKLDDLSGLNHKHWERYLSKRQHH
uniref:Ubiquitin-like domain-containing CTD phosphatase 1 n=1 Tax=Gasterosteus aculeatus aculeatus TaxID=481459 RepID=A0AAQ4QAG1_GASAC